MSKARGLADLGNVYSDGALSNRNMIVNGGFGVWQRAVSSSNLGLSYYTADRFWSYAGGSGNVERSTDVPDGFIYSLLWNRASGGSLGTSVELSRQGFNPYGMLTCSMYLKGNFTGTALYLNFRNYSGGGADSVAITTKTDFGNYTDWTRVTIPVDCTGIAAHANNKMLNIEFGNFPVGGKITGLQLEAGDTATPFEHRSYGDELARCQRYFYNLKYTAYYQPVKAPCWMITTTVMQGEFMHPVTMRTGPTLGNNGVGNFRVNTNVGGDQVCNNIALGVTTENHTIINFGKATANLSIGNCGYINAEVNNDAELTFDAEL